MCIIIFLDGPAYSSELWMTQRRYAVMTQVLIQAVQVFNSFVYLLNF